MINEILIRPTESISINLASSKYYDGHSIKDSLENIESAELWISTIASELEFCSPFCINETELNRLRRLRSHVLLLFSARVEEDDTGVRQAARALADDLNEWNNLPTISELLFSVDFESKLYGTVNVIAAIAMSALLTATGKNGRRLRRCQAQNCVLFYTQGNKNQRWCSDTCGNRFRVMKCSQRHKQKRDPAFDPTES